MDVKGMISNRMGLTGPISPPPRPPTATPPASSRLVKQSEAVSSVIPAALNFDSQASIEEGTKEEEEGKNNQPKVTEKGTKDDENVKKNNAGSPQDSKKTDQPEKETGDVTVKVPEKSEELDLEDSLLPASPAQDLEPTSERDITKNAKVEGANGRGRGRGRAPGRGRATKRPAAAEAAEAAEAEEAAEEPEAAPEPETTKEQTMKRPASAAKRLKKNKATSVAASSGSRDAPGLIRTIGHWKALTTLSCFGFLSFVPFYG